MKTTKEIEKLFIKYFEQQGHTFVESCSLVPKNDPTLLFTNAGMNQFKDVFLGQEVRPYKRAVTVQRCMRAGGKHNDLENVGYTKRHHTFFEMLGNFSFGDYFKEEAIKYAWEFLTGKDWLNLPKDKLWITVHKKDDEAAKIWLEEIKINKDHFSKCGDEDNFWAMGETGPCGYCSEIYFDYGADIIGDPPGGKNAGERYVEIWNLVFMQFERDQTGKLTPLPNPSIDTGMGLERIAAVIQTAELEDPKLRGDNYATDFFGDFFGQFYLFLLHWLKLNVDREDFNSLPIFNRNNTKVKFTSLEEEIAFKVISDHVRSAAFLIKDEVSPSNEGRGYVLRKIIRRAVRFLYKLNCRKPFLGEFCRIYLQENFPANYSTRSKPFFSEFYPELIPAREQIADVIEHEEDLFLKTLDSGTKIFEDIISKLKGKIIHGAQVFLLYDTYGFPLEITKEMAKERGLEIDEAGFNKELARQRQRSREASKFKTNITFKLPPNIGATKFEGYEKLATDSQIISLFKSSGEATDYLSANEDGVVILDQTPFYAESGGQTGDTGIIDFTKDREVSSFEVTDTKKQGAVFLHFGKVLHGTLMNNQKVKAEIDSDRRQAIKAHHSAAHLLHKALRDLLGAHVEQRGSSTTESYTRFDFSHFEGLTADEMQTIEAEVNKQIRNNLPVTTQIMSLDEAKSKGAVALFDEKYSEQVRVVSMGDYSMELCGGTHVKATGDIGVFKLISELAIAAGVRRIEVCAGEAALIYIQDLDNKLKALASLFKTGSNEVFIKAQQALGNNRTQEKEIARLKKQLAVSDSDQLLSQAIDVNGIKVLAAQLENTDVKIMRSMADQLKQQLDTAVILLITVINDKIQLVVGVSKNCSDKFPANELAKYIAAQIGGSGGGKNDSAQGGGTEIAKIDLSLKSVTDWVKTKI